MSEGLAVTWDPAAGPADNARRVLPEMMREFFRAGRRACAPGLHWEEMHQFRLEAKRVRYALELLAPLYGPSLHPRIKAIQNVQTLLGQLNDCATTLAMLQEPPYPSLDGTPAFVAALEGRARKKAEKFRRHWEKEFDAQGQEERWVSYLARYAKDAPQERS